MGEPAQKNMAMIENITPIVKPTIRSSVHFVGCDASEKKYKYGFLKILEYAYWVIYFKIKARSLQNKAKIRRVILITISGPFTKSHATYRGITRPFFENVSQITGKGTACIRIQYLILRTL